ncbi:MAG: hypothetical protein GY940_47205 [bacterium]|nr:hypothetical protein [bacterium]
MLIVLITGCKSKKGFDITGAWVITIATGDGLATNTYIFTGTKERGTVEVENILSNGDYTVSGDTVQFSVTYGIAAPHFRENFTGTSDNEDSMGGDFSITFNDDVRDSGTWEASR